MDFLMDTLKDKARLIQFLLATIQEAEKEKDGMMAMSESLTRDAPNFSPANLAKCIATTMKITSKQSHAIQQLAIIALIGCQSSSFDSDVVQMLNKLGRGNEALQQMFKNKMNGK